MSISIPNDSFVRLLEYYTLKPTVTEADARHDASYARSINAGAYCTYPHLMPVVSEVLKDSDTIPVAVIGFPYGIHSPAIKVAEARYALDGGARELNMVMNIAAFANGNQVLVKEEATAVVNEAHARGAKVKLILETHYLGTKELQLMCLIADASGVDFVDTSTSIAPQGAEWLKTRIMLMILEGRVQVKATGGIILREDVEMYLQLGCTRIGVDSDQKGYV